MWKLRFFVPRWKWDSSKPARIPRPALSSDPPKGLDMHCGMQQGAYKPLKSKKIIESNIIKSCQIHQSAGHAKQFWKKLPLSCSSVPCVGTQDVQPTRFLHGRRHANSTGRTIDKHIWTVWIRMDIASTYSNNQLSFLVAPCLKLASSSHDTVPLQTQKFKPRDGERIHFQGLKGAALCLWSSV